MKIEIHIDNQEIQDVLNHLKDQGIDVTASEVEAHFEDYILGAIEDSRHERMEQILDSIIDFQD
jgi:hypothetical protein